jgi:hypothetical protein
MRAICAYSFELDAIKMREISLRKGSLLKEEATLKKGW